MSSEKSINVQSILGRKAIPRYIPLASQRLKASQHAKKDAQDVREAVKAYQTDTSRNKSTIDISNSKPTVKVLSDQMYLCATADRDSSNDDLDFVQKNQIKIIKTKETRKDRKCFDLSKGKKSVSVMQRDDEITESSKLSKFNKRHSSVVRSEFPEQTKLWSNPAARDDGEYNTRDLTKSGGPQGQDQIHSIYQNYTDFKNMGSKIKP